LQKSYNGVKISGLIFPEHLKIITIHVLLVDHLCACKSGKFPVQVAGCMEENKNEEFFFTS